MLCPEVWNFKSPSNDIVVHSDFPSNFIHCESLIKNHHFNHGVSVVLPGCPKIPEELVKELKNDCDYYKVSLPVSQFIDKKFIDLFVKTGELSALSIGTRIDIDNCACITPSGLLVLSLVRETYQRLGLEGVPWEKTSSNPERYAVSIDLKKDCFKPGKPNYDRVHKSLSQFVPLQFHFIIAWDPPADKDICPSSLASYLHSKGHDVRLCEPTFSYKNDSNVMVPSLIETPTEELIEWLGAFCHGILEKDLDISETSSDYLSSYKPPYECENISQVVMLHWTGFFTATKILQLFSKLRNYMSGKDGTNMPWFSLNVIGFCDSPLSWDSNRHTFHINGNNNYTIFLKPSEHLVTVQITPDSSKKKMKTKKWVYIEGNQQKKLKI